MEEWVCELAGQPISSTASLHLSTVNTRSMCHMKRASKGSVNHKSDQNQSEPSEDSSPPRWRTAQRQKVVGVIPTITTTGPHTEAGGEDVQGSVTDCANGFGGMHTHPCVLGDRAAQHMAGGMMGSRADSNTTPT